MVYSKPMSKTHKIPKTKPYELKSKTGSRNVLGGSGEYWNKIAQQSEARFKKIITAKVKLDDGSVLELNYP